MGCSIFNFHFPVHLSRYTVQSKPYKSGRRVSLGVVPYGLDIIPRSPPDNVTQCAETATVVEHSIQDSDGFVSRHFELQ